MKLCHLLFQFDNTFLVVNLLLFARRYFFPFLNFLTLSHSDSFPISTLTPRRYFFFFILYLGNDEIKIKGKIFTCMCPSKDVKSYIFISESFIFREYSSADF